jgi:carbonic anhydrase/acetyltransferase-like protein (isoleucine patch superfamily)
MTERANVFSYGDWLPEVHPSAFIAPGAYVVGKVRVGEGSSVWYGTVLRGDLDEILVGERTSIQDNAVVHMDAGFPVSIGDDCVVGHAAVVHGCEIGDRCLIGMNATVLTGAKIGEGSVVAAGAMVPEGREYPPRSLIVGVPAKRVKEVTEEQTKDVARGARSYVERAAEHRKSLERGL